jgi:hypothetical protein
MRNIWFMGHQHGGDDVTAGTFNGICSITKTVLPALFSWENTIIQGTENLQ